MPHLSITFTVPFDGDSRVLTMCSPSGYPGGFGDLRVQVSHSSMSFTWKGQKDSGPLPIKEYIGRVEQHVARFLTNNNRDAETQNAETRAYIRRVIEQARADELQRRDLSAALDIPLARKQDAAMPVRIERTKLPTKPAARDWTDQALTPAESFMPEPVLAQAQYEQILVDLQAFGRILEQLPGASKMDEEELRNLFLAMLNTNYQAGAERFNGKGKTDILVAEGARNVFIGECKFYKGPASVTKAVDQLLGYLVWRDTKAALLIFVRGGSFTDVVAKAVEAVASHQQCKRRVDNGTDPARRTDFVFHRSDDPDRLIHLALLPFQVNDGS